MCAQTYKIPRSVPVIAAAALTSACSFYPNMGGDLREAFKAPEVQASLITSARQAYGQYDFCNMPDGNTEWFNHDEKKFTLRAQHKPIAGTGTHTVMVQILRSKHEITAFNACTRGVNIPAEQAQIIQDYVLNTSDAVLCNPTTGMPFIDVKSPNGITHTMSVHREIMAHEDGYKYTNLTAWTFGFKDVQTTVLVCPEIDEDAIRRQKTKDEWAKTGTMILVPVSTPEPVAMPASAPTPSKPNRRAPTS